MAECYVLDIKSFENDTYFKSTNGSFDDIAKKFDKMDFKAWYFPEVDELIKERFSENNIEKSLIHIFF